MCGISGIIDNSDKAIEEKQIRKMNDLIFHRGPDDEGFYFGKNFAFGHRRLSILDLSKDGHQPMSYLDKYVITYNGEVYNYLEIREELVKYGYCFTSETDTEVILASYDRWGDECVSRFNGMWAFAIYDREKNIIFCSRDRFGVKPFYYTQADNKFIFGSEIKQLLQFHRDIFVNEKVLADYIITGFHEHTNETFFENVIKLEQSHNLIYDLSEKQFFIKKYYEIKKDKSLSDLSLIDAVKLYSKELKRAVHYRLRSDVKVGTCLSGGLDSSSIAAIASEHSHDNIFAIHAKSTENKSDESFFAREVSKYTNLDLVIVEPSHKDFVDSIQEVFYTQEEPFASTSIFMQYFVMKKSKEMGCKVMLDGQGGDETLLGYERYYPAYLMSLPFGERIKGLVLSSRRSNISVIKLLKYILYFTNPKLRLFFLKKRHHYLKPELLKEVDAKFLKLNANSYLDIFKLQEIEITKTQLPHLLRYEDKNAMRHSIETRLPFVDYKALESAINLNDKHKIRQGWTKYILRESIKNYLPDNVVWRKNKLGFEAPEKHWIASIEKEMLSCLENSKIITQIMHDNFDLRSLNDSIRWRLYSVAKWEEVYNVTLGKK